MSYYRRSLIPGGTYFFTVALANRQSATLVDHIEIFRTSYQYVVRQRPFETIAICILPDHLHAIWTLPPDDANYSGRWNLIKGGFSRRMPTVEARSVSKISKREKGIWQRRYWEHQIRDEKDLEQHVNYVYYNPVKHSLVKSVSDWPYSSFHRDVKGGLFPLDWAGGGESDDKYGE